MKRSLFVLTCLVTLSSPSLAQFGPDDCNGLGATGRCIGDDVEYCSGGQLVRIDCTTLFPNNPATCGEVSEAWGFDCLIESGAECLYNNSAGERVTTFCEDEGACIVDLVDGTSECVAEVGVNCLSDDDGNLINRFCRDSAAMFGCSQGGTYAGIECGSSGACLDGRCIDIESGGACDSGDNPARVCAQGLLCGDDGECVDDPDVEPATSPGDPEMMCSAASVSSTTIPLTLCILLLLMTGFLRRRRVTAPMWGHEV